MPVLPMPLFAYLEEELKRVLLARDVLAVEVIKLVKSAVLLQAKSAGLQMPDDASVQAALGKQIKNCREAAELYRSQGQQEVASQKMREIEVLEGLLPAQLSQDELEELIEKILREAQLDLRMSNFKPLLERAVAKAGLRAGRADLARILKERLEA